MKSESQLQNQNRALLRTLSLTRPGLSDDCHSSLAGEVVTRVELLQFAPAGKRIREGFAYYDDVDLMQLFTRRGHVMSSVPQVMKGAHTAAMRISVEEVLRSTRVHDVARCRRVI